MYKKAKQASHLFLPALLLGMLLLAACENDLNKIKQVSALQVSQPVDTTLGVEVIYSDSAIVKAKMTSPLMIQYTTVQKPYYKMPNGVKVIFFDQNIREQGNIVGDLGIYRLGSEQLVEFHRNVVATDSKGQTYKSDELIWDLTKKVIYSNKPVQLTTPSGNVMNGTSFRSDENFYHPILEYSTGKVNVTETPEN